jgi:hypothetical protein
VQADREEEPIMSPYPPRFKKKTTDKEENAQNTNTKTKIAF